MEFKKKTVTEWSSEKLKYNWKWKIGVKNFKIINYRCKSTQKWLYVQLFKSFYLNCIINIRNIWLGDSKIAVFSMKLMS